MAPLGDIIAIPAPSFPKTLAPWLTTPPSSTHLVYVRNCTQVYWVRTNSKSASQHPSWYLEYSKRSEKADSRSWLDCFSLTQMQYLGRVPEQHRRSWLLEKGECHNQAGSSINKLAVVSLSYMSTAPFPHCKSLCDLPSRKIGSPWPSGLKTGE